MTIKLGRLKGWGRPSESGKRNGISQRFRRPDPKHESRCQSAEVGHELRLEKAGDLPETPPSGCGRGGGTPPYYGVPDYGTDWLLCVQPDDIALANVHRPSS